MGMAASQARFLGLTARKTNVEFEGQQVNQQRTTLSNQSANYYNDLLGMSVPVPPSVDDYTKTVYTFEDGALTNQITAMIAQGDGTYTVSYLRQWTDDFSVVSASTSIVNRNTNGTEDKSDDIYKVGSTTLRNMTDPITYDIEGTTAYYNPEDKNYYANADFSGNAIDTKDKDIKLNSEDDYLKSLSADQVYQLQKEEAEYLQLLQQKYGDGDYLVRYVKDTTTGEYNPYFYKLSDLESKNTNYDDNGNSQSNINCYKIGSETKSEEVKAVKGCQIEKDSSGRYIKISIPNGDTSVDYALTTSTVTDQAAYDDAMNQYEFEKYEYDQAIQEINSKIEIVQAQDKNLELRLKQLDTEQDAIQTEMDAVQKVIEKNTESTFKTFG